jgi:hypothetical protein
MIHSGCARGRVGVRVQAGEGSRRRRRRRLQAMHSQLHMMPRPVPVKEGDSGMSPFAGGWHTNIATTRNRSKKLCEPTQINIPVEKSKP